MPFRLLPEAESSGWLDTLYLSDTLRISTGNKGTSRPPPDPTPAIPLSRPTQEALAPKAGFFFAQELERTA